MYIWDSEVSTFVDELGIDAKSSSLVFDAWVFAKHL